MTDTRPAVFFDRDGVLNQAIVLNGSPRPPRGKSDMKLEPGAAEACARLRVAAVPMVVITNQPDIARGTVSRATVDSLNGWLQESLGLDAIYVCPHDDSDACSCRKPAPGMLYQAARELGLDLARSVVVGDRWRDIEAGRVAGCATVFLDKGYRERRPDGADLVVQALPDAIDWILVRIASDGRGVDGHAIGL